MPEPVYQFVSAIDAQQQVNTIQWMHRCLHTAHEIEQWAMEINTSIKNREDEIASAEKKCQAIVVNSNARSKQEETKASQIRSEWQLKAENEHKRVTDIMADIVQKNKLDIRLTTDIEQLKTSDLSSTGSLNLRQGSKFFAVDLLDEERRLISASEQYESQFSSTKISQRKLDDCFLGGLIASVILGFFLFVFHSSGIGWIIAAVLVGVAMLAKYRQNKLKQLLSESLDELNRNMIMLNQHVDQEYQTRIKETQERYESWLKSVEISVTDEKQTATLKRDQSISTANTNCTAYRSEHENKIRSAHVALSSEIAALNSGFANSDWNDSDWLRWEPSQHFPDCLRIGVVIPDMPNFRQLMPELNAVEVPALIDYEAGKGMVVAAGDALPAARQMAQSAITRLLGTVPPAHVRFILIDPVSLGGNVAGFMSLEKYESSLVGGKAWSDARHIEQALTELTEHMETVIQKYLREDFKSIAHYNSKARVKEAYRVLVIFDFPVNFTETTVKRLVSIMRNGPRCGVFPIIIADNTKPLPYGMHWHDLTQHAIVLQPVNCKSVLLTDDKPPIRSSRRSVSVKDRNDMEDDDDE